MRQRMKKLTGLRTFILMLLLCWFVASESQAEEKSPCVEWTVRNQSTQNYSRYASTIKSYLFDDSEGYIRVQHDSKKGVFVEHYDKEFQLTSTRMIEEELPIFGGVHETEENFYLVTGQTNAGESADVEVYRVTKYDKSWNRISSVGLYDCNTTVPFDAGTVRMANDGEYLLIRTCHEMYASSDGVNHQANVMIQIDMETMEIVDSFTDVMNTSYGYVSHSFNQFIETDNGKVVALDHGDAFPRSFVLTNYENDISTENFLGVKNCTVTDVMTFAGVIGNNTTNATAGGLEVTPSSYLVVGNSVVQDDSFASYVTRNVFVASVNKDTKAVTTTWLTEYAEGETTTRTPQMVKLSDTSYLILWERADKVFYTTVDASGKQISEVHSSEGYLSDCVPIYTEGKVVWYVCDGDEIEFYQIDTNNLSDISVTSRENGHDYQYGSTSGGAAIVQCIRCGEEKEAAVPSGMDVWWNTNGGEGYYSSYINSTWKVGQEIHVWIEKQYSSSLTEILSEMEIIASDSLLAEIVTTSSDEDETLAKIILNKPGMFSLTIQAKYNPEVSKTVTFYIYEPLSMETFGTDCGLTQKYGQEIILTTETKGGYTGRTLRYTYKAENEEGEVITLASSSTDNRFVWKPEAVGTYKLQVSVTDGETTVTNSLNEFVVTKGDSPIVPDAKITAEHLYEKVSDIPLPEGWEWQTDDKSTALEMDAYVGATAVLRNHDKYLDQDVDVQIIRPGHQYGNWATVKAATCTETGSQTRSCTVSGCSAKETEAIVAKGHSWNSSYTVDKKASCTETGSKSIHCGNCDARKNTTTIAKSAHTYGAWATVEAATCTEAGSQERSCTASGCSAKETETIAAKGHSWNSSYAVDKKASCTGTGSKSIHCGNCDAIKNATAIAKIETVKLSYSKTVYSNTKKTPTLTLKDANGEMLVKDVDYTVGYSSSVRRNVGRYKVTVTFIGAYEGTKELLFTIVPKKTSSLTSIRYQYGNQVQLSWTKATGATGYRIEWKKPGTSTYKFLTNTKNLSYTKSGLLVGKSYSFKVTPYYEVGGVKYYSTLSSAYRTTVITTVKKGTKLTQISKPTVTKSGTKVKVKWKNVSGETGYQISRSTSKTGTNIVATYKTTSGTSKLVTATKGKTYYYKVRAYRVVSGKKIYGAWSSVRAYIRK